LVGYNDERHATFHTGACSPGEARRTGSGMEEGSLCGW
jgi:hypothetical protein